MVALSIRDRRRPDSKMSDEPIDLDIKYHVHSSPDDTLRFQQAANWILNRFDLARLTVSISIVDDSTIHELNRTHLNHDWPTDVISFVFEQDDQCVDGEVIASMDTAKRLCDKAGWRCEDELLLYVVHGLLHLAGLDDVDDRRRQEMRVEEQACLMDLGVDGAEHHLDRWKDVSY